MKQVAYTSTAAKALKRHGNRAAAIRAKVAQYAADPASLANNVIILTGVEARRLRVGDFRVIFTETATTVTVLDIGPRGGIYD
ncbi:mRNA interferase RelE/StbE [Ancylobacter sp. 3268]|uniref:type II toxin-antitoxin system RelE family toxin n=1 Tax=Ancylobacter sp. 3268 TaxID=2817752 RepID=UPI00285C8A8D|nr:type II toxin-antitoxin system RelE/ParE family toxin [Ancylobacter sp. 3268]MDR6953800.1 mRNA interferase RelE/StbE [Ancylobacter sp. 3268]